MATHGQRITMEEYLRTSYHPDLEFIDGYLEEKPMGTWDHGRVQGLIFAWFLKHEGEWNVRASIDVRTRVEGSRVRLPDVVVDHAGPHPPVLGNAPLLAIEVLSLTDIFAELRKRAKDYHTMGIRNIWLIEPETRSAKAWDGAAWVVRERLAIDGTAIYLDTAALFRALDAGEPL